MEWLWIVLGITCAIIGVVGSFLPLLPGPPLAFIGLWLQQLRPEKVFSTRFLITWLIIVIVTVVLDYIIPVWGTKKFGGSKYGMWGCTLGFILAFWMGPWGVIFGPLIGAFIGEMIAKDDSRHAMRAAMGSFVGFLLGSFLKVIVCFMMLYYIISSI